MTGDPLCSPHQCRPRLRLVHLTLLPPTRTPARLYQPPEATPCALGQSTKPASQSIRSANWPPALLHLITLSPACRQPSSRRMPTQWVPVSLCPCRPGRAEVTQPPACSRSEIQFPPPPTESETPRESKDEDGRTGHITSQGPPPQTNITRACTALHRTAPHRTGPGPWAKTRLDWT